MKIAIDVMGGDFAPHEIVKGAVEAARMYTDVQLILVGDENKIKDELNLYQDSNSLSLEIVHCSEVIGMDEFPATAVRKKKNSSIVVATRLVQEQRAQAIISAGSTGAQVVAALFGLGRIEGVERPVIATPIPSLKGTVILVDSGANVDSKPKHLVQSAYMGTVYAQKVFGINKPKVGLLNIGEEEKKGNEVVVETYSQLKQRTDLNFIGNVEGRDIPAGTADVVVCDGFVGNIVLKLSEGLGKTIMTLIKEELKEQNWYTKLAGLLVFSSLKNLKRKLDYAEYGGAPLLGVNGGCIICHGSSKAKAICSSVRTARELINNNVMTEICQSMKEEG